MRLDKRCAGKGALKQDVRSHRFMTFVVLQSCMHSNLKAGNNEDLQRADDMY